METKRNLHSASQAMIYLSLVAAFVTWAITSNVVSCIVVVAYSATLYRLYIGRKQRLDSLKDPSSFVDDYTLEQVRDPFSWRQIASRWMQFPLLLTFSPAVVLWAKLRGCFSAAVPYEYYLTVSLARSKVRGELLERWIVLFCWVGLLGTLWYVFQDSRPLFGFLLFTCYIAICIEVIGYAVLPHPLAEMLKFSSRKSPILQYWLSVPVIATTMWMSSFLVSVSAGIRTFCRADVADSLSNFVQYKTLIRFADISSSRMVTEPFVIIELVPAFCLFLLVVPGIFRIGLFRRNAVDRLRQSLVAIKAVYPELALSALDQIDEIGRSDSETEMRTVASVQLGDLDQALKEVTQDTDFERFEKAGLSGRTVALWYAREYPATEDGFRKSVRNWLDSNPTPIEVNYLLLTQKPSSFMFSKVICQEVSRRKQDDELLAVVNWQINVARHGGMGDVFDCGHARDIGWLPESVPLSIQLAGDISHVISKKDDMIKRIDKWSVRLSRWNARFRTTSNGLDAVLGLILGHVALSLAPESSRQDLYDSLICVKDRIQDGDITLPPQHRPEHFREAEREFSKHLKPNVGVSLP